MIHVHSQFRLEGGASEPKPGSSVVPAMSRSTLEPVEQESRRSVRARLLRLAFVQTSSEPEDVGDEEEDESVFRFFDFLNQQEGSLFQEARTSYSSHSSEESDAGSTSDDDVHQTASSDDSHESSHGSSSHSQPVEAYFFSVADSESVETDSEMEGDA